MAIFPKKIILTIMISLGVVLSTPLAYADAWGSNMAAAVWTFVANKIGRHIEGVLLGSLKMTAMRLLNSQIGQLIGGGGISGEPRFITNWEDALITTPERNTQLYMNDFFTLTTRGMSSSTNYIERGNVNFNSPDRKSIFGETKLNNPLALDDPLVLRAEGMVFPSGNTRGIGGGNYAQYLEDIGRSSISGGGQRTMTLNEYTSSPEEMFRQGDWRAFDAFMSNPMNNPYGYSIVAEQTYREKLEMEKEIARTQAIAYQGFRATQNVAGIVTTPGITIKGLMDDANDFGNKIIAGASNPAELAGSLASAAVSKAINGLVNYGVNQVEKAVMKPIMALDKGVTSAINGTNQVVGPAVQFMSQTQRDAAYLSGSLSRSTSGR